jgi:light-regulated signal transduction histidine kinase (bacteriophytochrome)
MSEHEINSEPHTEHILRHSPDACTPILAFKVGLGPDTNANSTAPNNGSTFAYPASVRQTLDENEPLMTSRFSHVMTEDGHAVVTGYDGETLHRCEDEPIHIPGAVQGFGALIALEGRQGNELLVKIASENSEKLTGYTPKQLFALESFTDILSDEETENLWDHVEFIREEDADAVVDGPEVFTLSVLSPLRESRKLWCAMHITKSHPDLIICEFELEYDQTNPLVPPSEAKFEQAADALSNAPTEDEVEESTCSISKPLRFLRSTRKSVNSTPAVEVSKMISQIQEQLSAATSLEKSLKILAGVVKELTGFHRVMIYQFDQAWNGRVVTELVDPRATRDLYRGLCFPASDIPKQARELYKVNKVRVLYDREQQSARLVCRTVGDLVHPLDLTHSYLRAMSPIHIKYLENMVVRSSMSISIKVSDELWGLISCHAYGSKGTRVSFPVRKICRIIGDSASSNIERLSYASRLQVRKLIGAIPVRGNSSSHIFTPPGDMLKLFAADSGLLSIRDESKIFGEIGQPGEVLSMLGYLRMRCMIDVTTSQDIKEDCRDLDYPPGFKAVAGFLLIPLSSTGQDFVAFFRKPQMREVHWAGNPYEKLTKKSTYRALEPRKSFKAWSETVTGKCREWSEEDRETAAIVCLVYGRFIKVWRQEQAGLQNSQPARLRVANAAQEVRTPLNAIISCLDIALEGNLDQETRYNLGESCSAAKSLIYVVNDLLDLSKVEKGSELLKDELFNARDVMREAAEIHAGDASRKNITYAVTGNSNLPTRVIGDARRVKQAISNVIVNAIQNTSEGGVSVEMTITSCDSEHVEIEVCISDTGSGIDSRKMDALFLELEQVQSEGESTMRCSVDSNKALNGSGRSGNAGKLGLGLAVVSRTLHNMNGQLRVSSKDGEGSCFVLVFPFRLPA